jgi:sugar/nucleoside kinase (ribokinase family)
MRRNSFGINLKRDRNSQIDLVICGRIIIDTIRLPTGKIVSNLLGGGGPQAAFGARLWNPSVGLLIRSGVDMESTLKNELQNIGVDLSGWVEYPDLTTPKSIFINYDSNEQIVDDIDENARKKRFQERFGELHSRIIPVPESYSKPRLIHYLTDYAIEPMTDVLLNLKGPTTCFSLEPMFDHHHWINKDDLLDLVVKSDIVSPDWESASGISGSNKPKEILKHWSKLGAKIVAVRDGKRGSYVWDGYNDQMWHIPILKVNLVDPTGCGNSYAAGLCAGWGKYEDVRLAAGCATVSASFTAESVGVPPVTDKMEQKAQERLEKLVPEIRHL